MAWVVGGFHFLRLAGKHPRLVAQEKSRRKELSAARFRVKLEVGIGYWV